MSDNYVDLSKKKIITASSLMSCFHLVILPLTAIYLSNVVSTCQIFMLICQIILLLSLSQQLGKNRFVVIFCTGFCTECGESVVSKSSLENMNKTIIICKTFFWCFTFCRYMNFATNYIKGLHIKNDLWKVSSRQPDIEIWSLFKTRNKNESTVLSWL